MSIPSARAASSIPTSVASPRDFPVRSGASSAAEQAAIARPRNPSTGSAATARSMSIVPLEVELAERRPDRAARIRFSVSVPVLSVQMTSVSTRVSPRRGEPFAVRRGGRGWPRRRRAPASASARGPSGTLATIRPIAKVNASPERQPRRQPADRGGRRSPTATETSAISQATRRTCCSSGLCLDAGTARRARRCGRARSACRWRKRALPPRHRCSRCR